MLIISNVLISCNKQDYPYEIRVQNIHLDSLSQVIPIEDSLVVPALYDTLLINNLSTISEKKQQFIYQVLPAILIVKFREQQKFDRIEYLVSEIDSGVKITRHDNIFLDSLVNRYKALNYKNLLVRLKPHPTSLVLAQAAVESGWGQSRFALEGNNLFGIWATPNDNNSQKSLFNRGNKCIFVKKYDNLAESIEHYFFTISKNNAYRSFRAKRFKEESIYKLIDELHKYSESGDEYTEMLKHIINWNNLTKYDNFRIDDRYIIDTRCVCYKTKKILEKFNLE